MANKSEVINESLIKKKETFGIQDGVVLLSFLSYMGGTEIKYCGAMVQNT